MIVDSTAITKGDDEMIQAQLGNNVQYIAWTSNGYSVRTGRIIRKYDWSGVPMYDIRRSDHVTIDIVNAFDVMNIIERGGAK